MELLKKNIKIAYKNIRYNFKQFIPFFISFFLIQICFGILFSTYDYSAKSEKEIINNDYNYHVIYYRIDDSQLAYIQKYSVDNTPTGYYKIVETIEVESNFNDRFYDIFIKFNEPEDQNYRVFKRRIIPIVTGLSSNGSIRFYLSPLLSNDRSTVISFTVICSFLIFLISFALLTILYSIRVNNFRFEYGIYMACGADFKKLSENSLIEMIIIVFSLFVPSLAVSSVISSFICGKIIVINVKGMTLVLIISLIEGIGSVFFPMFTVSKIYPMKSIAALDNTNYVSSPRMSFEIYKKSLERYRIYSVWRFRKYIVAVTLAATSISIIASSLYYGKYISQQKNEMQNAQFTVKFNNYLTYDNEFSEELRTFPEITSIYKSNETKAKELTSHIAFEKGTVLPFSGCVDNTICASNVTKCTDNIIYTALDSEVCDYIEQYKYDGDIKQAMNEGYCIISDTRYNLKRINICPGDKIYIAVKIEKNPNSKIKPDELMYLSGEDLLKAYLDYWLFSYKEYTVAAVIHNLPSDNCLKLYLNNSDYLSIIGKSEIIYDNISLYINKNMSVKDVQKFENTLKKWASSYTGIEVENLHSLAKQKIMCEEKIPELFAVISIIISFFSPIIWFFSENVFYGKRKDEFQIIGFLGATGKEIRKICINDAVSFSIISAFFTAIISFIAIKITYIVANMLSGNTLFLEFSFPFILYLFVIIMSGLFSALSVLFACRLFIKKHESNKITLFEDSI